MTWRISFPSTPTALPDENEKHSAQGTALSSRVSPTVEKHKYLFIDSVTVVIEEECGQCKLSALQYVRFILTYQGRVHRRVRRASGIRGTLSS